MRKIWVVIRREFLERVRSKWFLVSTILGPVFFGSLLVVPVIVATRGSRERTIAVLDLTTTGFGERLASDLSQTRTIRVTHIPTPLEALESTADSLERLVVGRLLDGFLLVTDETVDDGRAEYRGSNVSSPRDMQSLTSRVEESALAERLAREGVDPAAVRRARLDVRLKTTKLGGPKGSTASGEGTFALAYAMWFLLYMAIILYGVSVMGSVVEEKTSRVIEVLVSSLRPFQLLAGKIIGVGAVGLLQFAIWIASAALLRAKQSEIIQLFGGSADLAGRQLFPSVPLVTVVVFLSYFVLGYFLYAAMFAAVAAMSNSEAEARQAQMPIVMLLVIPSVLMIGILNDPNGSLAETMGVVPFFSPIVMPVRWAAAAVPLTDLALSLAVLVATLVAVTWIAARIYRVGILMYGKRPSPREIWRWIRTA